MSRAVLVLNSPTDRQRACAWATNAPVGTRVEFKEIKRSLPQNDRMWAMLTEISKATDCHGIELTPDEWKVWFMDALSGELRVVPNMAGTGFVHLGRRSSQLSRAEMGDLMELIEMFAAQRGIVLHNARAA